MSYSCYIRRMLKILNKLIDDRVLIIQKGSSNENEEDV